MTAWTVGFTSLGCIFGGAVVGMLLRRALPAHHLGPESKSVVQLGMGLIATMAALLLGLLVSSAKSSYDADKSSVTQMAAKVVLLDRLLAHYGPESSEARAVLRKDVQVVLDEMWPADGSHPAQLEPFAASTAVTLYRRLEQLAPQNDQQRELKAEAMGLARDLGQARWMLYEQAGSSIPSPFLITIVFWLTIIFMSIGLFAPPNATVVVTLLICALSVSGAIFLILELDQPFDGLIQISGDSMRMVLRQLTQ